MALPLSEFMACGFLSIKHYVWYHKHYYYCDLNSLLALTEICLNDALVFSLHCLFTWKTYLLFMIREALVTYWRRTFITRFNNTDMHQSNIWAYGDSQLVAANPLKINLSSHIVALTACKIMFIAHKTKTTHILTAKDFTGLSWVCITLWCLVYEPVTQTFLIFVTVPNYSQHKTLDQLLWG